MIATQDRYTVQSTVSGEKVAMTIADDAMGHIMSVLTDLYSNKLLAIIREYSTNALDAQIQAGVTRPIEVQLPNALSQFLKVRDFGVGLDASEIREIYSQYGASTKRATNDQVGMLGLGCKSALTYQSQFTLVSIKDGVKITVSVARDEDGAGSMSVVNKIASNEPNGTEIVIPIKRADIFAMQRTAATFFEVWDEGTVLVDGDPPRRFEGLRLNDNIYLTRGGGTSRIVMGNVAYPAPQLDSLADGSRVTAFVPIGAIVFPPSREALQDHSITRATLDDIKRQFHRDVQGVIQREVDAADDVFAAIRLALDWERVLSTSSKLTDFSYRGTPFPEGFELPIKKVPVQTTWGTSSETVWPMRTTLNTSYNLTGVGGLSKVPLRDFDGVVWVEGYDLEKFTATHKKKLRLAVASIVPRPDQFILLPTATPVPRSIFVPDDRVLQWEDVRKLRLAPSLPNGQSGRIPGSYDIVTETTFTKGVPGDDLRQEHPIMWLHGSIDDGRRMSRSCKEIMPHFTIVCLYANRVDKFERIMPAATTVGQAMATHFKAWAAKLTDAQKFALRTAHAHELRALAAYQLDDPALRWQADAAMLDTSALRTELQHFDNATGTRVELPSPTEAMDDYPLFNYYKLTEMPEHVVNYINAAYAAKV